MILVEVAFEVGLFVAENLRSARMAPQARLKITLRATAGLLPPVPSPY